ncbi:hypothetical protein B6U82_00590 [Candidatus Pacearchaeota archaeon ex4484_31]|nr:MAG: hypothetical protein B6U82_00590 [Candidatus Pacearchaeota archaeon ex4484_31]
MIRVYEIGKESIEKVKKILEAEEKPSKELDFELETEEGKKARIEKAREWAINEFKRQGFILRDAKALGIEKECFYLYINASNEFFERNEKILVDAGAKPLEGKEMEEVKKKIETSENKASESFGFLFK